MLATSTSTSTRASSAIGRTDVNPPPNLVEYAEAHTARHRKAGWRHRQRSRSSTTGWATLRSLFRSSALGNACRRWLPRSLTRYSICGQGRRLPVWFLMLAGAIRIVDWAESAQNFTVAARGESPPRRAFLDSIYWIRALGVVLFVFGMVECVYSWRRSAPGHTSLSDALNDARPAVRYWVFISLGAGLGVGPRCRAQSRLRTTRIRHPARVVIQAAVIGPVISTAVILLATIVVYEVWRLVGPALDIRRSEVPSRQTDTTIRRAPPADPAGTDLLPNAFSWAGRPMTAAYLGSIVRLQLRASPQRVKECLDSWCSMLGGRQITQARAAACALIVRETLYRDIIGFIPVYSLVFTFGLWFGAWQLGWTWLQALWLTVPLIAAAADYAKTCAIAISQAARANESPSLRLTWLGTAMTWIKLLAFIAEVALMLAIVMSRPAGSQLARTIRVARSAGAGGFEPRFTIVMGLGVWSVLYRWSTKVSRDDDAVAPREPHHLSLTQHTEQSQ